MQEHIRRIFAREVERQTCFALMAINDLNSTRATRDMDRLWYSVQAMLVAVGNVSKLLWPPRKESEERGTSLRAELGVSDDSVLAPRTFRNHFEHFDERLEDWASSAGSNIFVDSNVGPPSMIVIEGMGQTQTHYLRNFDTKNVAVTFRGDSYALQPIATALTDLYNRAKELANKALNPTGLRPAG
jgi:hypothetical protein